MKVINITAKRDGFRRAGMAHPGTTTQHPVDRFTDAQLEALLKEPNLVVWLDEVPDAKPAAGAKPDPKK